MKARSLLRVSVVTSPEAEEAVSEAVDQILGTAPTSYLNVESGEITVSAYLEDTSGWPRERRLALRERLDTIHQAGLHAGRWRVRATRLRAQDWAESWKRHFRPLVIGKKLLVLPRWIKRKPLPGQEVVMLDPGLSFGTGHHPTTGFCLKEIVRAAGTKDQRKPHSLDPFARKRGEGENLENGGHPPLGGAQRSARPTSKEFDAGRAPTRSFLDLGSGSGILAIAAVKLGFSPVDAVEIDPDAVRVARANARQNAVDRRIRLLCQDLHKFRPTRRYCVVCANLISNLLIEERERTVRMVEPGGTLVLAGVLASEFSQVAQAYEDAGAVCVRAETRKEWRSGAFRVGRSDRGDI